MMTVQNQNVDTALAEWIINRTSYPDPSSFNEDTKIIDDGLLTSLDVVELILFIEDLRGAEVDVESLEPESFLNVKSLKSTFFA